MGEDGQQKFPTQREIGIRRCLGPQHECSAPAVEKIAVSLPCNVTGAYVQKGWSYETNKALIPLGRLAQRVTQKVLTFRT